MQYYRCLIYRGAARYRKFIGWRDVQTRLCQSYGRKNIKEYNFIFLSLFYQDLCKARGKQTRRLNENDNDFLLGY